MSSKGVRACAANCGRVIPDADPHTRCLACLGVHHAQSALALPDYCPDCTSLGPRTLLFRATLAQEMDAGPSSLPCSQPAVSGEHFALPERLLAEQEDLVSMMEQLPPLETGQSSESAGRDDDEVISLAASEADSFGHPLQDEGAEAAAPAEPAPLARELAAVLERATAMLGIAWPPPEQKPGTRLDGTFFKHRSEAQQRTLPPFADYYQELSKSWARPYSARSPVQGFGPFSALSGAADLGLEAMPRVESALASYLAPPATASSSTAALPSKPCRFTAAQGCKAYACMGQAARTLNTAAVLMVYTGESMQRAAEPGGDPAASLPEWRRALDLSLRALKCVTLAQGRAMAHLVVQQRHLWLTLSQLSEKEKAPLLDAPIAPSGLFGSSMEEMSARFEAARKEAQALQSFFPRKHSAPQQPSSSAPSSASPRKRRKRGPRSSASAGASRQPRQPQAPQQQQQQQTPAGRGWKRSRTQSATRTQAAPRQPEPR